jgi:hypothetical protein
MVTNYPQQLTAAAGAPQSQVVDGSIITRAVGRFGQLVCGLRGHDEILHFEGNRVMMRCTSCGHDTPGWEITGGPRRRYEGDARRHSLTAARLVLRKTA